ncbi:MAG: trypsin-like peptidase domain-containing protein [Bacteroidales bacterium]|nr:trypsin-like peptidase domain-containing protein [Bacteroidales bacterium]
MVKPYAKVWVNCFQSVCSIRFFNGNDIEIITLTGFKSGCYIFTNDLVNKLQKAEFVEIKFVREDGYTTSAFERLSMHDFTERIITTYDEEITGFAVISITDLTFDSIPPLELSKNRHLTIGNPVAAIGFQYDSPNLTIKSGIISTFIYRDHKRYLQFDGSMIWGNSGSPLIDLSKGEVLGILGYHLDRKYKSYEKMLDISKNNIKMLEQALGKFDVSGVDPIQVLIAWERQIKQLSGEVYRASFNGMGMAIDSKIMRNLLKSSGIEIFGNH